MDDLHNIVKNYFSVEAFGVKVPDCQPQKKEDERAQEILEKTVNLIPGQDRYEIGHLYKDEDPSLVNSKPMAESRLSCAEKKMDRNRAAGSAHVEKINEYIMKGYARKLDPCEVNNNEPKAWYLPHFVIDKPHKPGKYRLVFDATAKIHGKSLNDYLLTGPDLLNSLASVIIKFRQNQIGFSGDIRDMFHQVRVRKEDLASQRFLWRGWDREKKPDIYQMEVLIFGGTSSPTSTIFVTHKNADAHREEYPEAAVAIKTKHYMDDYLDSKSTVKDAIQIIQGVTEVHRRGGFEITGWVSNSEELIKLIPEEHRGERMKNFDSDAGNKVERVLGLHWDTTEDCWSFPINFKKMQSQVINGETHPTKRQILGVVMSIFDPIGLIAHYTVKGKMLLQAVWRSGYGWDDEITGECLDNWKIWIQELESIKNLKIPRCYATFNCEESEVELHVFCDASELAYAAAAYFRIDNGRTIETSLVMAKSRVAPLKSISIPRMELMAAVMGTRLGFTVKKELEFETKRTVYWSDNKTVLCWIRAVDTRRYKQFVAHRVGEILESTEGSDWKWVPTLENVADDATRNTPSDLTSNARWFRGPEFLCQEKETWPAEGSGPLNRDEDESEDIEVKTGFLGLVRESDTYLPNSDRFNFMKLLRITAYMLRFIERVKNPATSVKYRQAVTPTELAAAEKIWWRKCQKDSFPTEVQLLQDNVDLWKSKQANHSRLLRLSPIMDEDGIIRLRGRIDQALCIGWDTKQPVILDDKHPFVIRMIDYYHRAHQHQGQEAVFNDLRRRYWILGMRSAVKKSWIRCNRCKLNRAKPSFPEMGALPPCRVAAYEAPFTYTGLDYFGPVEVIVGRSVQKRWVALFVCMTSRAIHVEIARRIDTDEAINALRKFMSIRGQPRCILSDNGTNFRGADGELKKAIVEWKHQQIEEFLLPKGVEWKFIPPQSPHMGGNWERMVKTVLKNSLRCRKPTDEVFEVYVKEAADIVNSSPLSHVSTDADDPRSLTANDLLRPGSGNVETPGKFIETDHYSKEKCKHAQILVQHFWDRWIQECLPAKVNRKKWHEQKNPDQVGEVVIVVDDQLPRNR
ncbi:uncharacterized protein LOC110848321 [Folsomia candida]|uniref:uncharacterized protein LOC110848321 n=1 Tax=Folsomia candida TaxID=158441 RepID=UPI000B8F0E24|nr:uncharacterized protein LOC110848321 [Folsomia candida]